MIKIKLFTVLLASKTIFCGCDGSIDESQVALAGSYKIKKIARLDPKIDESSGIISGESDSVFWTHNDGSKRSIFKISRQGRIIEQKEMPAKFIDIEDITKDDEGNFYIADVGNNTNKRSSLHIYKYSYEQNVFIDTIAYAYPDQQKFPPPAKEMNFDCEAVFFYHDSLYLFSKNRGLKNVKLYVVPASKGKYKADIIDQAYIRAAITGASINPSKTKFAILTYGYLYLYAIVNNRISFSHLIQCLKIPNGGQMEAVCFYDDNNLLITNEGGRIFEVRKKK